MTGVIEIGEFVAGSRQDEALSFGQLTQMDRHHFLLARIAVSASFATRRIRVLLDVLAMFSSAFAAAMIASFSSALTSSIRRFISPMSSTIELPTTGSFRDASATSLVSLITSSVVVIYGPLSHSLSSNQSELFVVGSFELLGRVLLL